MTTDVTWNPATGVNDLKEIRRAVEIIQPGSKEQTTVSEVLVDMANFYESCRTEFIPRLCDEVERLREQVREYAKESLRLKMVETSSALFGLRWRIDWEFILWECANSESRQLQLRDTVRGRGHFTLNDDWFLQESKRAGGWYHQDAYGDVHFINLTEWLPMFDAWKARQPA